LLDHPRRIARDFTVCQSNLERFSEDILITVLGCGGPFVGTNPGVNVGRLNLVSNSVRERLQDELHPSLEVPNIPAVVVDIPFDGLLGEH
jgi:hypothetical protein